MTLLKIRGGDLDLVEYEFKSFKPGECIYTADISITKSPYKMEGSLHIRTPARIHLSVLDMNRFKPETPGGGGIGFAIQVYTDVIISCTDHDIIIDSPRKLIIEHLVHAFKRITGYTGGFKIQTNQSGIIEHVGLGSTSTMATAVVMAMNSITSNPLTQDDIRRLIGYNYVEETEDKERIIFGFETGVGSSASIYGGFTIIGDDLTRIYTHSFAESKNVYIVIPRVHEDEINAGVNEFNLLMNRARDLDARDREIKAYHIIMDVIPALDRGDLKKIGDVMWELEFRGSKRAEIQHHSVVLYKYMDYIRHAGIEFVAMSSIGPSICIVTDKTKSQVQSILDKIGLEIIIETKIDNVGTQITKE